MTSDTVPVVTVVIPNYNCGRFIRETLESISNTHGISLEVIIVDDASTDNSREMLTRILPTMHYPCRTIFLERNHGGPSRPRNIGFESARGRYLCFVDADDILLPGTISEAVAFYELHPDLGFIFFDALKFDEAHGDYPKTFLAGYRYFRGIGKESAGANRFLIRREQAYGALIEENYVQTTGVVTIRSDVFRHVGSFDESLTSAEDKDMWLRITNRYDIGFIDRIGLRYRVRRGSIESRGADKLAPNRIRVLKKQLEVADLSAGVRDRVIQLIAENLYSSGYHYQSSGNMTEARKQYRESLRESPSWPATKGLLLTLLGRNLYAKLKKISGGQLEHP